MFNLVHTLDAKIQENENKIEEIDRLIEVLNQQTSDLWRELQVSPQQMQKFLQDQGNFTDENWQFLIAKKKELDDQLKKALNAVHNPLKTREKMKQRKAASNPQWLYVK